MVVVVGVGVVGVGAVRPLSSPDASMQESEYRRVLQSTSRVKIANSQVPLGPLGLRVDGGGDCNAA